MKFTIDKPEKTCISLTESENQIRIYARKSNCVVVIGALRSNGKLYLPPLDKYRAEDLGLEVGDDGCIKTVRDDIKR